MGWDNFGESGKKARWNANFDKLDFSKFPQQDIELRIVTETPFTYATHWYYKDVAEAWLHANDREALKAKYPQGLYAAPRWSFECCDYDHATKRSRLEHCPHCTTYEAFEPYSDKTTLFQAFWRIPNSSNPQLQRWQSDLKVISLGSTAAKRLNRVVTRQGLNITDDATGYSIFVQYNKGAGADTWVIEYGKPTPLNAAMQARAAEQIIDFLGVYEPGDPADAERTLNSLQYPLLLDPSYDGSPVATGRRASPATQQAPARAQAGRQAPAAGRPGAAPAAAYGRPARPAPAQPAYEEPLDEFGGDPGFEDPSFEEPGFEAQGSYDAGFAEPGFEEPIDDFGGFEDLPPVPSRPAARPAAPPARPAAPPQRPQAAAPRPTAPAPRPAPAPAPAPARPAAPPQRPQAPGRR